MSTAQFSSRRKPRQFPFPVPIFREVPSRLPAPSPEFVPVSPSTPAAPGLATGFFTLPAGTRAAAGPQVTLTASSLPLATVAETAAATTAAAAAPVLDQTETEAVEDFLTAAELPAVADVGEAVPPLPTVTATAAASGTGGTMDVAGSESGTLSTASPGGIAFGSIAGVAFFVSLMFLLYKWRKGTLPQTLRSATGALKFRRSPPDIATAAGAGAGAGAVRDVDIMEKGLGSDTSSIRSQSASIHSVSSLSRTFSALKRSASGASSRRGVAISAPAASEGQQADKLAVPLPLHLARLEAAGLWTADGVAGEAAGKMDPKPVVEEPDVHPLRAHRVHTEGNPTSWPLKSVEGSD